MRRAAVSSLGHFTLALVALAGATQAALAQETIATAQNAPDGGAPPPYQQTDTLRLGDHVDREPEFLRPRNACGGPARTADGKLDHTPHGEVFAGVGTRGYREGGGVVCVPLNENSAVSIAVDAGHIDGYGRHH
jgi:hypothetical protein